MRSEAPRSPNCWDDMGHRLRAVRRGKGDLGHLIGWSRAPIKISGVKTGAKDDVSELARARPPRGRSLASTKGSGTPDE